MQRPESGDLGLLPVFPRGPKSHHGFAGSFARPTDDELARIVCAMSEPDPFDLAECRRAKQAEGGHHFRFHLGVPSFDHCAWPNSITTSVPVRCLDSSDAKYKMV